MKKPVKKFLCTVTALLILSASGIVFTGCGKDSSSESSSSKVEITVEKTTESEHEEIVWPAGGLADKLPIPKSTIGEISTDSEDYLNIIMENTSYSDFQQYVNDCKNMGFTVDYNNLGDTFYAKDSSGNDLSLYYNEDEKTMDIILDGSDEEETTVSKPKTTKSKTTTSKSSTESSVSADFKETMDSYEEFFDEYVDFMNEYKNSDDIISMATDYADYLSKYSDMISKFNAIGSEELSAADLAYYTEVNARITKKLAEVDSW